jgi:hypothetical protein
MYHNCYLRDSLIRGGRVSLDPKHPSRVALVAAEAAGEALQTIHGLQKAKNVNEIFSALSLYSSCRTQTIFSTCIYKMASNLNEWKMYTGASHPIWI